MPKTLKPVESNPAPSNKAWRRTLVLAGNQGWCRDQAVRVITGQGAETLLWIGADLPDALPDTSWQVPARRYHQVLGTEVAALVFDAHDGFDPDAFGAATGTLRGGGLLLLLTPPLDDWPAFGDPERQRIATAPYRTDQVSGHYLRRLAGILRDAPGVSLVEQSGPRHDPIPEPAAQQAPTSTGTTTIGPDQAKAVDAVIKVANGHRRRPVVLTADRGRGKSAALGIAAARLLLAGSRSIAVTGPRLESVRPVFEHCAAMLPGCRRSDNSIHWHGEPADAKPEGRLIYLAPDELLAEPQTLDLLLVDEAAALTTSLLERLLKQYNRIAFATTVHGYEGTGRGFALRFSRNLDRGTRGWRTVKLETPIRWAADDPLEALSFRALLLNAEAAPDDQVADATADDCELAILDREQLAADETSLRELFGLLVLAHYRTRPYDLRHLLDGPNLTVMVLRHHGHVVATALVAAEGGFDADACHDIWAGRRRPHGHLLPESLSAHLGLEQAPRQHCLRVMRIAVHPAARRRGLGLHLLTAIADLGHRSGVDYLGSSFGADPELLAFWARAGYQPVRIAIKTSAASGNHSAIVLQGLSDHGQALCELARQRFAAQLPYQLGDHLRQLDPDLALQLLSEKVLECRVDKRSASTEHAREGGCAALIHPTSVAGLNDIGGSVSAAATETLDNQDWLDLIAFACARRVYEACLAPIYKLTLKALSASGTETPLTPEQRRLLLQRVIQRRSWSDVAAELGFSGRADTIRALRGTLRQLLFHYGDSETRHKAGELPDCAQ
jgi:tRNA(Met) cytidine acetyltransferase